MKHCIRKLGMFACTLLTFMSASAYDFCVDGIYYNITDDTNQEVEVTYKDTDYNSYSEVCTIPEVVTYNDAQYSVTTIGDFAFNKCASLSSVTIPNSVTAIKDCAFADCSGLNSITFGAGLNTIGYQSFRNCNIAKAIWLGNTPPTGIWDVGADVNYVANERYALGNQQVYEYLSSKFMVDGTIYVPVSPSERTCDIIDCLYTPEHTEINIGESVTNKNIEFAILEINPYSYYNNDYIERINISHKGNIGEKAFSGCDKLQTAIVSNTGHVGAQAFFDCGNLISATISNRGDLCDRAFYGCVKLETVTVSNTGNICDLAFYDCDNLQTVTISNAGNIGNRGFYDCDNLLSASISNAGNIGEQAFYDCDNLQAVIISNHGNIEGSAFGSCGNLQSATITNQGNIGVSAFDGCSELCTVEIGQQVTGISNYAFYGCSSIKNIVIPNSVNQLGTDAFRRCESLESVTIGAGITHLPEGVFSGCSALSAITIPNNIRSIGNDAFNGCTSLADIVIEDGANKVDRLELGTNREEGIKPLFSDCPLDELYIGRKLSYKSGSDYYSPFYRNTTLRSVEISDAETEIYDNEFYGCSNLRTLKIGDGVTTIGNWAFSGCSSLDYFSIGSHVETIGQEAFSDCTALTKFYSYASMPPVCGNQALDDINKWECSLNVPQESIEAYKEAPQWREFFFMEGLDGIDEVTADVIDSTATVEVYNLNGVKVSDTVNGLPTGIYIVRQGSNVRKISVK